MAWKTAFAVMGMACVVVLFGLFGPGTASAQMGSPALLSRGKTLWVARGCSSCHAIGRKQAGPDLAGVTARRSKDWLRRWLKDTEGMLASDSLAQAMLAEYKNQKMPSQKLSDQDVDALLAYIDARTATLR